MDFAFVLDPLPLVKAYKDTSVAMLSFDGALGPAGAAPRPACCIEADAESMRTKLHTVAIVRIRILLNE